MKNLNFRGILKVFLITLLFNLIFYYGLFMVGNEVMYRISYEVRNQYTYLYIVQGIALLMPIVSSILYFVFRNKLREMFNTSNRGYTLLVSCILYLFAGIILNVVVGLLLKNNIIAYCSDVLENDIFFSCNLRGIEYIFMMVIIFLPLIVVPIFELLIFIHKKITKREKMDFIDILIIFLVFIIICTIIWLIFYTLMN